MLLGRGEITVIVRNWGIDFALWEIAFNLGTGDAYLHVQWKAVPNQMLRETETNDFFIYLICNL